jgi:hypothetical protein
MEDTPPIRTATAGDLVVEPDNVDDTSGFDVGVATSLDDAYSDLTKRLSVGKDEAQEWLNATQKVRDFAPVPWFIWRLTNLTLAPGGLRGGKLAEGFVLGLRRLLFATASDRLFGTGQKVNTLKDALMVLSPEVIGAVSAVHAICRRLSKHNNERMWRPIVDEALLRARIGYLAAKHQRDFGSGRGLLAGFISQIGLAVLVSMGEEERARTALEDIAVGKDMRNVARDLYECHPLQVGGMILSAIGCGADASSGVIAYLSVNALQIVSNFEQRQWLAAITIVNAVRDGTLESVEVDHCEVLSLDTDERRQQFVTECRRFIRGSHELHWLE